MESILTPDVLFAQAGFVTKCESYDVTSKSGAVSVGYALRLFGDWFGVSQTNVRGDASMIAPRSVHVTPPSSERAMPMRGATLSASQPSTCRSLW